MGNDWIRTVADIFKVPYTTIRNLISDVLRHATDAFQNVQSGSNMTGTNCDLFTHNQSLSYLNHLVYIQFKKTEMGRICGTYRGDERCIQGFNG
jgi:hypothetical protein